jgi:hypothetical protein
VRQFADDAELLFNEAQIRFDLRDFAGAEACWKRVETTKRPERFSSYNEDIHGHLCWRHLADLAEMRCDVAEAVRRWRMVLGACPGDSTAEAALQRLRG